MKNFDYPKLKAFADGIINVTQTVAILSQREQETLWEIKEKMLDTSFFLVFPTVLSTVPCS